MNTKSVSSRKAMAHSNHWYPHMGMCLCEMILGRIKHSEWHFHLQFHHHFTSPCHAKKSWQVSGRRKRSILTAKVYMESSAGCELDSRALTPCPAQFQLSKYIYVYICYRNIQYILCDICIYIAQHDNLWICTQVPVSENTFISVTHYY